jgi:hypothetical protein
MSNVRTQKNGLASQSTDQSNGIAVAGLVCGIVGLAFGGVVLGPLAVIFGGLGVKRANRGAGRRTMAKVDIGLGILSIVAAVVYIASRIYVLA